MSCVIVGAGFAGVTMALKLMQNKRQFTLISPRDYFHCNMASVRAVTIPGWAEKSLVPLTPCFGNFFKEGTVVDILPAKDENGNDEGRVVLDSGEEVPFKYLVIATGTTHKWPMKLSGMDKKDAFDEYAKINERVKAAKSIAIVGGGATGVEIAAEFAHHHPDKKVTLIHNTESLLHPELTEKSQKKLQDILGREMGVSFVLNERVSNLDDLPITGPGTVTTDKGTTVEADVLFKSVGLKVDTTAFRNTLASSMNQRGALNVDECFRVAGHKNIFAIGDCTSLEEPKLAAMATKHGDIMAQTIMNLDQGKEPVMYKAGSMPMLALVSLGPEKGFGRTTGDWTVPSFLIRRIKAGTLFTGQWWGQLKQDMPKLS